MSWFRGDSGNSLVDFEDEECLISDLFKSLIREGHFRPLNAWWTKDLEVHFSVRFNEQLARSFFRRRSKGGTDMGIPQTVIDCSRSSYRREARITREYRLQCSPKAPASRVLPSLARGSSMKNCSGKPRCLCCSSNYFDSRTKPNQTNSRYPAPPHPRARYPVEYPPAKV